MNFVKRAFLAAALMVAAIAATPANATPILQGTATTLTGINGLVVGSSTYNVSFVDGTCASVYGVCDAAHFTFGTQINANAAAQAILSAIAGTFFDTHVGTVGCTNVSGCQMFVPFGINASSNVVLGIAINLYSGSDLVSPNNTSQSTDTTSQSSNVYTVFSLAPATEVPEPFTLSLFGAGIGGLAFIRRNRKKVA